MSRGWLLLRTQAASSVVSNYEELIVAGLAIITEACIDVKDRACVDVCPVQCIYEFDPEKNILFSEEQAGSGIIETRMRRTPRRSPSSATACCT